LGRRVADLVDGGTGYHGVDLLLGDATDGADDVVLELNPRMTTSYVGLRHATSTNIAELMLVLAERGNRPSSNPSWECESMAFQVDKLPG
jgi:predicted ATP-grasp superfamily ATP-dependent carboligase